MEKENLRDPNQSPLPAFLIDPITEEDLKEGTTGEESLTPENKYWFLLALGLKPVGHGE